MPVTNHYSVGGVLLGMESTATGRLDYLTDALGSVVGTVTQAGAVQNTYRYKPYGTQLAKTGTGTDPNFLWVGTLGYWRTGRAYSDVYVRARHYSTTMARWTTPVGHEMQSVGEYPYAYTFANPIRWTDATGHCADNCCCSIKFFRSYPSVLPFPPKYGHKFRISVIAQRIYKQNSSDPSGTCKLKWEEKSDYPPHDPGQPNVWLPSGEWYDPCDPQWQKVITQNPERDFDNKLKTIDGQCESDPVNFKFVDLPGYVPRQGTGTFTERLCIRVTVTDGCTGKEQVETFWQKYLIINSTQLGGLKGKPDPQPADVTEFCRK